MQHGAVTGQDSLPVVAVQEGHDDVAHASGDRVAAVVQAAVEPNDPAHVAVAFKGLHSMAFT